MNAAQLAGFAVVLGCALGAGSIVFFTLRLGIGPTPSNAKAISAVLAEIPLTASGPILELGAGFGALAVAIARRCPSATVIAYERSFVPFWFLRARRRLLRLENLRLEKANFFDVPLGGATHVVCYLFPGAMDRLATKLLREMAPGTSIVTHTFALPGWKPVSTKELDDLYRTKVYLYRVETSA